MAAACGAQRRGLDCVAARAAATARAAAVFVAVENEPCAAATAAVPAAGWRTWHNGAAQLRVPACSCYCWQSSCCQGEARLTGMLHGCCRAAHLLPCGLLRLWRLLQ